MKLLIKLFMKNSPLLFSLLLASGFLLPGNISAAWSTDLISPVCNIGFGGQISPKLVNTFITVTALADDSTTGGLAIDPGALFTLNTVTPPGVTTTTSPTTGAITYTYPWIPSAQGFYNYNLYARDTVGNWCAISSQCPGSPYPPPCVATFSIISTPAWLKTTGGDVHSNTGISVPYGP